MDHRPDIQIVLGRFGSGGVERVTCILANGFADQDWFTEIAVVDPVGVTRSLVQDNVTVTPILKDIGHNRGLRLLKAIVPLARHIRNTRPQLLMSPGNHTHFAVAIAHFLARRKDVQLVVKITNPICKARYGRIRNLITRLFYRWVFKRCAQVLTLSPKGTDQVRSIAGAVKIDARFVHNPYIRFLDKTPTSNPRPDVPLILAVGRLSEQKNFGLLLRALALLDDRPWRLAIVGEGPQEAMLKTAAEGLGIRDRVDFAGFVSDPTPYYAAAACLVLSSLWEDLPAVALEAMAAGCPLVTTDSSPALKDIVDGTGFGRVVAAIPEALAAAIKATLDGTGVNEIPEALSAYSFANGIAEHCKALRALIGDHSSNDGSDHKGARGGFPEQSSLVIGNSIR